MCHSTRVQFALLWCVLSTYTDDGRLIEPFGPKMCERLCVHTFGCSAYMFTSSHLVCEVTHLEQQTSPWKHIGNPITKQILEPASCPPYSKIIFSRAGRLCCRRRVASMQDESDVRSTLFVTTLMAFKREPVYELSFPDAHVQKSITHPKKVRCMLHVAATRTVLLFLYLKRKKGPDACVLASLSLDNKTLVGTRSDLDGRDMVLDTQRNMIVLAVAEPRSAIYKMSTDGKNFKFLFHPVNNHDTRYQHTSVAVDAKKGLIYACVPTSIVVADVEGRNIDVVHHGEMLYGIAFDPCANALYFGSHTDVKKLLLADSHLSTLISLEAGLFPLRVVYHKDYVYIACSSSTKLFRYYLRAGAGAGRNDSLHGVTVNGRVQNWIFCIKS